MEVDVDIAWYFSSQISCCVPRVQLIMRGFGLPLAGFGFEDARIKFEYGHRVNWPGLHRAYPGEQDLHLIQLEATRARVTFFEVVGRVVKGRLSAF